MDNSQINPVDAYFLTLNSNTTVQSYVFRIRAFCKFVFKKVDFNQCNWAKLTYIDVLKFMKHQESRELAHTSINVTLSAIKAVSLHAWQLDYISTDNFMRIKSIKNIRGQRLNAGRTLTQDEIISIKRSLKAQLTKRAIRDYALFALSCGAGLRRRELMLLNIEHILTDRIVIHGKGNKVRTV